MNILPFIFIATAAALVAAVAVLLATRSREKEMRNELARQKDEIASLTNELVRKDGELRSGYTRRGLPRNGGWQTRPGRTMRRF